MAEKRMKAAVLHGREDLRYEDIPRPVAGPSEVLIDVKATGVCGSDVPRVFSDAAHFYPLILGHEFSGVVAEVGPGVDTSRLGQHVAVAPLIPCHECDACSVGRFSQCRKYRFIGSSLNGALAEYVVVPERNLVPLGPSLSFVQGALVEPSSVALHAIRVAQFRPGLDVAVMGAGMIGNFTAQWAKLWGARTVTAIDVNAHRLEVAKEVGATHVINASEEDLKCRAQEITEGRGFGWVFETAGQNITQRQALELAGVGGAVTLIGTSHRDLSFPAATFECLNRKELTLSAAWMSYSAPFPGMEWFQTVKYMEEGRLLTPPSLLHGFSSEGEKDFSAGVFKLSEVADGMRVLQTGAALGKVMFVQ